MGVSVTESFDAFLARLSSQAASRAAMTRGMAIEPYWGPQGDGPGDCVGQAHPHDVCEASVPF